MKRTFWKKQKTKKDTWLRMDKGGGFGKPFQNGSINIEDKYDVYVGFNFVKHFKLKSQALRFTKQYMRTH